MAKSKLIFTTIKVQKHRVIEWRDFSFYKMQNSSICTSNEQTLARTFSLVYWQFRQCRIHCISIWHLYGKLYNCRLFLADKISDLLIPLPKCCCNWGDARQLMDPRRETQARVVREPAGIVQRVWLKGGHSLLSSCTSLIVKL